MRVVKKVEPLHFRIYVRDEATKQTVSAGIYDHNKMTKEQILDTVINCLNKSNK